jgi:hypothetical protein
MRAIRNIVVVLLSAFAVVGAVDQARHLDKSMTKAPSMTKGPKLAKKTKGPTMSKLTTKAPTIKGSKKATLPSLTTILQTFFIETVTADGTTPSQADINLLAADLVSSYNDLVQGYTNPQALVMTTVTEAALIQGGITRRELQTTKAIAQVDVEGTCNGCGTDGRFTKNDSRRLQTLVAGLPAEIDLQVALDITVQTNTGYTSIVSLSNLEEEQPIAPTTATSAPVTSTTSPVTATSPPTIPKTTVAPVAVTPTSKTTVAPVGVTSPPTVSKALTSTPAPTTVATKSVTTTAPVTTTTAPVTTTTAPVTTTIAPTVTATTKS